MARKKRKQQIPEELVVMLDAINEQCDADDTPDGAWFAMLENTVTFYNQQHGTSFDENDAVHAYLKRYEVK